MEPTVIVEVMVPISVVVSVLVLGDSDPVAKRATETRAAPTKIPATSANPNIATPFLMIANNEQAITYGFVLLAFWMMVSHLFSH